MLAIDSGLENSLLFLFLGGGGCETGVLRVILWAGFLVVYANGVL